MSKRKSGGPLQLVTRGLLCGAVLWQLASVGGAEDKSPKQRGTNPRHAEHVTRAEPKPNRVAAGSPRNSGTPAPNQMRKIPDLVPKSPGTEFNPRFQPSPDREPSRSGRQPNTARANQLAFLPEKPEKVDQSPPGKGASRPPQTEKPVRKARTPDVAPVQPRPRPDRPAETQTQPKQKIQDRTNIGRTNNSQEATSRGTPEVKREKKVPVQTIKPDLKIRTAPQKADQAPGEKPVRLKAGDTLSRGHQEQNRVRIDKQHRDLVTNGKSPERAKVVPLPDHIKQEGGKQLQKLPREALKTPVAKNGTIDPQVAAKLKLRPAREVLEARRTNGEFQRLAKLRSGQTLRLDRQFQLHQQGDISRRMNLVAALQHRGGWRHRFFGPISPLYSSHCTSMWYAGPGYCSAYVWYPNWAPWIDWCWWDTCAPIYDPRPIYCQPIVYSPCSSWVAWQFPVWQPLPYLACGSWVDVSPIVMNSGADVQLLATRFVDPGHPEQQLGPRFRVWFRNNSPSDLNQAFNVLLLAATDANAFAGLPEAGVRVAGIRAGETQSVDIRLPSAANRLGRDSSGQAIPFTYLNVLIDSHNELSEQLENNNGATLIRGDILPVDPVAFAAEPGTTQPNGIIHVAGEGLGPEPGQVMVVIGNQEFQAEIVGWFDLGIQIRLPNFDLDQAAAVDLVIIRGDGAAANPLTIEIDPQQSVPAVSALLESPILELPEAPPLPVSVK